MDTTTKSWAQSLTIRGSLIGAFPAVYGLLKAVGVELPDGSLEAAVDGLAAVMAIASVVMTFIGRLRADRRVTL